MTGPLDEFLSAYGQQVPAAGAVGPTSFAVIVRTQGTRPQSLNEALDSLAAQNLPAAEVIVVVHGPRDRVDAVTESIGDRLPGRLHIVGIEGGGRAVPLNAGIDALSDESDYLCFLDDDDLVMPNWLDAFAAAIAERPGAIVRAVTQSQAWAADGGTEPLRATGEIELPFPDRFDLLAHMSVNLTPICSLAYPRRVVDEFGLRFSDDLPVLEDWDFLMHAAMAVGVVSITDQTSLYRRLDSGNADTAESTATWERAHALVIDRLSSRPVLLPAGDARRLAGTHFVLGGRSRHEAELEIAQSTIDQLTRSPVRWARAFLARLLGAVRRRT